MLVLLALAVGPGGWEGIERRSLLALDQ